MVETSFPLEKFTQRRMVKTKLDRLLEIIMNGRTFAMKQAAAKQLGLLQKEFSYDLSFLLHRIYPLFLHPDFDTRCAAAIALDQLKPESKPQFHRWATRRVLLSLSDFDVQAVLSNPKRLTHNATVHTVAARDYSNQIFDVASDEDVAEMCQLSEQMILKLDSENWHYRHGAVLCLLRTVEATAPSAYIEDLAVRLFVLLVRDRFRDMIGDMLRLPVQEPACQLLARCLMQNTEQGLRILDTFHNIQSQDESVLRFSFWVVLKYMISRDESRFEFGWIQQMLLESLRDTNPDTVAMAIEVVMPVINKLPNAGEVGKAIWALLENDMADDEDLAPYNAGVMKAVENLWRSGLFRGFMSQEAISKIFKVIRYPVLATRRAVFGLLKAIMECGGSEFDTCVVDPAEFAEFSVNLIDTLLKESSMEVFDANIGLIESLGVVAKRVNLDLNEDYCQYICDTVGGDDKSKVQNLPKIMIVLEYLAKIITLPQDGIVFDTFETLWGRVMAVVVCLHAGVSEPNFSGSQKNVFRKPPLDVIMSLFSLDLSRVVSLLDVIITLHSSLVIFVIKVIGRLLKQAKRNDIIDQLVAKYALDLKEMISQVTREVGFSKLIAENRPGKLTIVTMELIRYAVFDEPQELTNVESIAKLLCLVKSKAILSSATVKRMIGKLQDSDYSIASCMAYISMTYADNNPESFLVEFVEFMSTEQLGIGAVEFIDLFLSNFGETKLHLLPWASFFVPPCLANRANRDEMLQRMASHSLAQIVRVLPLDHGDVSCLPPSLHQKKHESMKYLVPLFDPTKAEPVTLDPAPNFSHLSVKLQDGTEVAPTIRDYQVDGINWLGFLHKYGLNGILADDMGLGKTFQCLCTIANAHKTQKNPLSLIICPSPVASHWVSEARGFFPGHWEIYQGVSRGSLSSINIRTATGLVVISYGVMCSDISEILKRKFCYCVLDEGHLIKGTKSKKGTIARQIISDHRLILSGTPIQNNVTELWSLMDFLMPGFLGSQKTFNENYNSKIQHMFEPNASEDDTRAGQAALDELHKQVLPFIMRRLKNDVLGQLPPKVIYDEVFQMTPEQERLYHIADSQGGANVSDSDDITENTFTRMHQQRKICIHPCLVDSSVPCTITHSAKLMYLKKLLLTRLGFEGGDDTMRNRALIFAQGSKTLDLVQKLVLDPCKITSERIDGSMDESERSRVIDRFKREDGSDVLLLTTKVGGLGLNLPVANIVIFVENSWNPTEDMQAMDRAHRLGQRRQVTVFNLITDGTIEVKIMNTQKRKRKVIDTIINADNASFRQMAELSNAPFEDTAGQKKPKAKREKRATMAELAEESTYDPSQYDHADGDSAWT